MITNQPCNTESKCESRQVMFWMEQIKINLTEAHRLFDELKESISPITFCNKAKDNNPSNTTPEEPLCDLADELRRISRGIDELSGEILDTHRGIQI